MSDEVMNTFKEQNAFLATKLFIPRSNARQVVRASLIDLLNAFGEYKMTLVSAPAGFGKTTILTQWVSQLNIPVAWLSLDEKDNDPFLFLRYLIAGLQTVDSNIGVTAAHALQTAKRESLTAILIPLLNDISRGQDQYCVILDDYHCIQSHEVHEILRYMLDHQPPQLHIMLSTRADPPISLAKMRARNNLSELRIGELCFTRKDITSFFNEIMGLILSDEEISTLEYRTEGWAAGLQLAAISLKGCDDIPSFIEAFSGDNRYIVDYLVEEVLNRQDEQIHDFLLRTSFLRHMTAELCDSILGRDDSQSILEKLEQQNLFIVSLDSNRKWFRYHHLFADLLYQRLVNNETAVVLELRKSASQWYENNGYLDSAIDYAITAEDYKRAAKLLEQVSDKDWEHGKRTKLFGWFEKIPIEYIHNNFELCLLYAWVLMDDNKQDEAKKSLAGIEKGIEQRRRKAKDDGNSQIVEVDEIHAKVMVLRALIETGHGDIHRIVNFAERGLKDLHQNSAIWRANAYFALGIAYSLKGDLGSAVDSYMQSMRLSRSVGNLDLYFRASYWLVARQTYAAQLDKATQTCEELFEVIKEKKLEQSLIGAGVYVSWGNILYEINRVGDAYENIKKDIDIIEASHDIGHKAWCYFCMLKVLVAMKDFEEAEKIIVKLEKLKATTKLPYSFFHLTESGKAQLWYRQGKLEQVGRWLEDNNFSVTDEIVAYRDLGQIILARYLLAKGEINDCKYLLNRLIYHQEKLGRQLLLIEALLIQAQVFEQEGDLEGSEVLVTRALELGEQGRCIRVFINEGKLVAKIVDRLFDRQIDIPGRYAKKVLSEFKITEITDGEKEDDIELLSERELEILRLIAAGLSNKKITEKLFISLSTVKTHLRNIYSKLDAHSRTEAVAKASDLQLL